MNSIINQFQKNFFPIQKNELQKILLICLLKGLISSIYCIFINFKDVIIVTAKDSSAETLSVVRGFMVLPFSILLVYIYSILSNKYKPTTIFYIFMSFFASYLLIYAFILRPNELFFSPINSSNKLLSFFGENNKHWIAVYRNWMHVSFYILSALWLQSTIFIIFWEFVNRVCNMDEAKRSYNIFIAAGGIFNFTTGFILYKFLHIFKGSFNLKFKIITLFMIFCIILLVITYFYLNKNKNIEKKSQHKTKLSFLQGIKHILNSKYLISLALIVISLGICSNLTSITWKANLKNLFTTKKEFVSFIIKINSFEQVLASLLLIFVSGQTIRKKGWKISAAITPTIFLITGTFFFLSSKFRNYLGPIASNLETTTLKLVALIGAGQYIITKVTRYCFYDMTKEMAYIPLDNESKVKGKAAIDTIGSRLGKSMSSYIHLFILWIFGTGSVLNITVILIPILIFVCLVWFSCINYIGKKVN